MVVSDEQLNFIEKVTPGCVALYAWNKPKLKTLYLSDEFLKSAQFSRHDAAIYNDNALDAIFPSDRKMVADKLDTNINTIKPIKMFYRLKNNQQAYQWVKVSMKYLGEYEKQPLFMAVFGNIGSNLDIYQAVLDNAEVVAYVCDAQTYEILYANKAAMDYGLNPDKAIVDKTCYEYIFNNSKVCKDCMVKKLSPNQSISNIRYNERKKHWEMINVLRIEWCGRDAFMHYIENINDLKLKQAPMGSVLNVEEKLLETIRIINSKLPFDERINLVLKNIGEYVGADRVYICEIHNHYIDNTFEWSNSNASKQIDKLQHIDIAYAARWIPLFEAGKCVEVSDIEDIKNVMPDEYALMKKQDIRRYVEVAINVERQLFGFIGIDNPMPQRAKNCSDLLFSLAYAIGNAYDKLKQDNDEQKHISELETALNNIPVGISMVKVKNRKPFYKLTTLYLMRCLDYLKTLVVIVIYTQCPECQRAIDH